MRDPAVISPARRAAYEVVRRVFEQEAYADRALRTAAADLDERARGLAQRLAFGTVQMVRPIDHAIDLYAKGKVDRQVRAALRLGAYPLGGLCQIPARAAAARRVPAGLARPDPGARRRLRLGRARAPRGQGARRPVRERRHAQARR